MMACRTIPCSKLECRKVFPNILNINGTRFIFIRRKLDGNLLCGGNFVFNSHIWTIFDCSKMPSRSFRCKSETVVKINILFVGLKIILWDILG